MFRLTNNVEIAQKKQNKIISIIWKQFKKQKQNFKDRIYN